MGIGRSKFPISFEEACRRAGGNVVFRLRETFDRYASNTGLLPRITFLKDIFGDGMPPRLAEALYDAFNGGQKGIKFQDLLRGLVVLIKGTIDEKANFLAQMLSEEGIVRKEDLVKFLAEVDVDPSPENLNSLFHQESWVDSSEFVEWMKKHRNFSTVTKWLLEEDEEGGDEMEEGRVRKRLSFTAVPDPPTFYQMLSDKFDIRQQDVMDVEKAYWGLKGNNGKFDESVLVNIMSPPLPENLCRSIFQFLDINGDSFIDLSEMVRGMALLCRRPMEERIRICFKLLDKGHDGKLDEDEMREGVLMMKNVLEENTLPRGDAKDPLRVATPPEGSEDTEEETLPQPDMPNTNKVTSEVNEDRHQCCHLDLDSLLAGFQEDFQGGGISEERFLEWSKSSDGHSLVHTLLQVILEVCHVKMGLHPSSVNEERAIVSGYMARFQKTGRQRGQTVNLISSFWFNKWRLVTGYEMKDHPLAEIERQLATEATSSQHKSELTNSKPVVKKHHNSIEMSALGSVGEPVGEPVVTVVDVAEETGVEASEGYTHIVTDQTPSSGSGWPFSLCSASSVSPSDVNRVSVATGSNSNSKEDTRLGPVDNTPLCKTEVFPGSKKLISLTNEGGHLLKGLREFKDYYVLPSEVWKALVVWYGSTGYNTVTALPRTVVDDDGNLELYPIVFKAFKHSTLPPSKQTKSGPWNSFLEIIGYIRGPNEASTGAGSGLPGDSVQPIPPRRVLSYTASFDKNTTVQQMCEHLQQVLRIKPEDLRIYDMTNEDVPELLDDEEKTVTDLNYREGQKILIETRSQDNTWPEELMAVMKEVEQQELDREKLRDRNLKTQGTKVVCGATGLSNLGNTCFMNSALQCLSNAQPLRIYFTEKDHYLEINKKNPLGMKGVMAKRYGELVQDLWCGQHKSITPLRFRFTIARYAPQFSNFQQQDAQELLSFVLDGIHEDLNRVQEKPYRELDDSDDRTDKEVSDEAWEYHLQRNNSVVVDLLQGQLKSLVQCTQCGYKSVKFDPFTFLSLPLPMEQKVNLEVIVVRLDGSQPVRYLLKQDLEEKYRSAKDFLQEKTKLSCFLLVDIFGGTIRSFPKDNQKMKTGLSGWLYAYEVPPPPRSHPMSRSESPVDIMRTSPGENHLTKEDPSPNRERDEMEGSEKQSDISETPAEQKNQSDVDNKNHEETVPTPKQASSDGEEVTADESAPANKQVSESEEPLATSTENPTPCDGKVPKDNELDVTDSNSDVPASGGPKNTAVLGSSNEEVNLNNASGTDNQTNKTTDKTVKNSVRQEQSTKPVPKPLPTYCSPAIHGFIFAIHRKILRVDNYFISSQKNRPVLFNIPMVVPCQPSTPRADIYETIWKQVQRLIIPDPPDVESDEVNSQRTYPFKLKMVGRDGLFCCCCPWYRFCRGCLIECSEEPLGHEPHYLAIEWDDAFLHLKYQGVLERPKDDESMEALKTQDNKAIDLSDCFQSFSSPEELGEDELWYCKKCKDHRPARKTLSIWRLPPILIVHLKRFQFNNGRWIKSQKVVNFPIDGLDPLTYTEGDAEPHPLEDPTEERPMSQTPPIGVDNEIEPLEVPIEVHQEEEEGGSSDHKKEESEEETKEQNSEEDRPEDREEGKETEEGKENSLEHQDTEDKAREADEVGVVDHTPEEEAVDGVREELDSEGGGDNSALTRPIYDLFAVTCHAGVLGGGHYTSFAKNPNSKWYYYNDSSCKETSESKVQSESAYMLFYEVRGLDKRYSEFRARSLRQGLKPNSSPSPANDEDDKEFKESYRPSGGNTSRGRGPGCRTQ